MGGGEATVNNTCRVVIDKNEYQVAGIPGQKLKVKKTWERLYFFDATGKLVSNHKRSYDIKKDFVDWIVELQLLTERPSAFKNSSFGKIIPSDIYSYLFQLTAPKRKTIFSAVSQRLNNGELFDTVVNNLAEAIRRYGNLPVADVVNGSRGIDDTPTDEIPQMQVPDQIAEQQVLPRLDISKYSPGLSHLN